MAETLGGAAPVVGSDPWLALTRGGSHAPHGHTPLPGASFRVSHLLSRVPRVLSPPLCFPRDHPGGAAADLWGQRLPDGHGVHQQHEAALPGPHLHAHGHLHGYVPAPGTRAKQGECLPGPKEPPSQGTDDLSLSAHAPQNAFSCGCPGLFPHETQGTASAIGGLV